MAVLDRVASSLEHLTIGRMGEEEGLGPQTLGAREWHTEPPEPEPAHHSQGRGQHPKG